jgi:hypothetical protein
MDNNEREKQILEKLEKLPKFFEGELVIVKGRPAMIAGWDDEEKLWMVSYDADGADIEFADEKDIKSRGTDGQ